MLAVPLGSTEQHGPHLPLGTDSLIAEKLCRRLAAIRPDVLVAPTIGYGASGEHSGFPGTISIGEEALCTLLLELARSADAFAGVLLLSAHGGNARAVARASERLAYEGRNVRAWSPPAGAHPGADAHAGHTETSVVMALAPGAVRTSEVQAGNSDSLSSLMPELVANGVKAVSPNGVLGDPRHANAAAGDQIVDGWLAALTADLEGWP